MTRKISETSAKLAQRVSTAVLAFGALLTPSISIAQAPPTNHFKVLYSFTGKSDGGFPESGLIEDAAGNLYGTTDEGGDRNCSQPYCGTVFKLAPDGTETVLHAFAGTGGSDGASPRDRLIEDAAGNLYSTTTYGGVACPADKRGCGTVFKLAPDGTETVLYSFAGGTDGAWPQTALVMDAAGNLYGTTDSGGVACSIDPDGCGTVFKLAPDGTETVLHSFAGGSDGSGPQSYLIMDKAGNLYGETGSGGSSACSFGNGCGTVFKVAPDGTETVLYSFTGESDGCSPRGGLVKDASGDLYGTTEACGVNGVGGTLFKLQPNGHLTVLYSFCSVNTKNWVCKDGSFPMGAPIMDKAGNFYGTTLCAAHFGSCNYSTVFKVAPDGTETVLHYFHEFGKHGAYPYANLLKDNHGHLFGTTTEWGLCQYCGTVFELRK